MGKLIQPAFGAGHFDPDQPKEIHCVQAQLGIEKLYVSLRNINDAAIAMGRYEGTENEIEDAKLALLQWYMENRNGV